MDKCQQPADDLVELASLGCARARVLVVDDEPTVRDILERLLQHLGLASDAVASGELALQSLQEGKFELLLTDLTMPGMSGLELVQAVQERYGPCGPKVVVCSGFTDTGAAMHCGSYGVEAVLRKPIRLDELRDVLVKVLGPEATTHGPRAL